MARNTIKSTTRRWRIQSGTGRTLSLEFLDDEDASWLKENISNLLDKRDGELVKSSPFATVLKFVKPQSGEPFFFKEFHNRGPLDKLRALAGATRGRRAFKAGKLLLEQGISTSMPVVYGFEKLFFITTRNFIITKGCKGERTYQYVEAEFPLPLSPESIAEKRATLYKAGREIGRLHRKGIFHGDLRVGNILIDGKGSSASFTLIDNERTRFFRKLPEKKRIKNLVQLNMLLLPHITRTDRLRFFNAYLKENTLLLPYKRALIRKIQHLTGKRHFSKSARMDNEYPLHLKQ